MPKPEDPAAIAITELLLCGLGVGQIAEQAGMSRTNVYRLHSGEIRRPRYQTVVALQRLVDRTARTAAMPKAGVVTKKL